MFAKISKGNGLRGALEYDFAPAKNGEARAEFICGTLFGTPRQMAKQAAPYRSLREVANPIWRVALSADPKDGVISAAKWEAIANDFLRGMGLADPSQAAWCLVTHSDKNHQHGHLSVVRVLKNGTLFSIQNDAFKAKKVTAELEQKYQLATHSRERAERRAPSIFETSAKKRTEKMSSKEQIQQLVDQILKEAEGGEIEFAELQKRLAEKGIDLKDSVTQKGRLQGFSYLDRSTGVAVSGSKLGADYSLGLLTRGVKYTPPNAPKSDEKEVPAEPKKTIPPAQYPAEQITHGIPAKRWNFDANGGKNLIESGAMSSPFAMVCVALSELAIKLARLGAELFSAIWAWLSKRLGLAGLGCTSDAVTRSFQIAPRSETIDVPSRVVPDPLLISHTADEINAVTKALDKNDSKFLPESARHLSEYFAKDNSSEQVEVEADPFGFMPHGDQEHEQAAATPSPLSLFLAAKTSHTAAQIALKKAMDSDTGGAAKDIWSPTREDREVKVKEVEAANEKLQQIKKISKAWSDQFLNKFKKNPHVEEIEKAQAKVEKLTKELKAMGPEKPRFTRDEVTSILVAQAVEKAAAEAINRAKLELLASVKNMLEIHKNVLGFSSDELLKSLKDAGHDDAKIRNALSNIKRKIEDANRGHVDDEAARLLDELADAPKA